MLNYSDHKKHLQTIFRAALAAADPRLAVKRFLTTLDLSGAQKVFVVGAGKAGVPMAEAILEIARDKFTQGVVAVPNLPTSYLSQRMRFVQGGHPKPNDGSIEAGHAVADLLQQTTENDLVIVLISGGGSALMEHLAPQMTLTDLRELTDHLLKSGAPIQEINCVRKHLSLIKGGGLASMAAPARVLTLILSDVIGDPLDVIASGPTVKDSTMIEDARAVLRQRNAPARFESFLQETAKDDKIFARVTNRLVGSNSLALEAAATTAKSLGFNTIVSDVIAQGEARDFGQSVVRQILNQPSPCALIFGGETTVTVKGNGRGGRNTELTLAAAIALDGRNEKIALMSAGTDGIDGLSPAAGAIATPHSVMRARALGADAKGLLEDNDSFSFFSILNDTIITGATGTNVNDVIVALHYVS